MAEEGVDPELQALTERIAAVRAAIDEEKAARDAIASTVAPSDDAAERELAALRDEFAAARARLADLEASPVQRRPAKVTREAAARRSMYLMGAIVAFPGAVTLGAMLSTRAAHPAEALEPTVMLALSGPLLLGLGLIARARFARYDAKRDDLGGDFLP